MRPPLAPSASLPSGSNLPFTYPFPRPAVTADTVLFAPRAGDLAVLLIQRKKAPFKGHWALPGGFVDENEGLEAAAKRELLEETGISGVSLEQLGGFGDPGRDPRGHTVSVAFFSFLFTETRPVAGDDAADAGWHALKSLPIRRTKKSKPRVSDIKLAFDHAAIIEAGRARLQEKLHAPTLPSNFQFIPPHFTLTELQRVYEAVFGHPLDKRDFRKRLLDANAVDALTVQSQGGRRSEQLYRWRSA
jgi:8-oxo-dGTP diphosphatase